MSGTQLPSQQEINRTLKKMEDDVREFAKRLEKAKLTENTQCKAQLEKLKPQVSKLQTHRQVIRNWMGLLGVKHASKDKLAAGRARIEQEIQRFQDLEKGSKTKVSPKQELSRGPSREPMGPLKLQDDSVGVPNAASEFHPDCNAEAEVKVFSEQLLAEDEDERQMTEEFVCKICQVHVVGCKPKLTQCSHLFCGDCIAKWFAVHPDNQTWARRAKSAGSVPCPVCKVMLHEPDLHTVCEDGEEGSALLWQMLCGTRIMCANNPKCRSDGKCDWVGFYGTYQEHIKSCRNEPMPEREEKIESMAPQLTSQERTPVASVVESIPKDSWDDDSDAEGTPETKETEAMNVPTPVGSFTSPVSPTSPDFSPMEPACEREHLDTPSCVAVSEVEIKQSALPPFPVEPEDEQEFLSDEGESDWEDEVERDGEDVDEQTAVSDEQPSLSSLIASLIELKSKEQTNGQGITADLAQLPDAKALVVPTDSGSSVPSFCQPVVQKVEVSDVVDLDSNAAVHADDRKADKSQVGCVVESEVPRTKQKNATANATRETNGCAQRTKQKKGQVDVAQAAMSQVAQSTLRAYAAAQAAQQSQMQQAYAAQAQWHIAYAQAQWQAANWQAAQANALTQGRAYQAQWAAAHAAEAARQQRGRND